MSKSSVLRIPTDSYVEHKFLCMIHEHFRATGACEAVQELSHLLNIRLQNDDVQDFDVRWGQALLSASETPSDGILEGLYQSKLQDSVQLQTVLALYDQETARNNGQTNYLQLKTAVKLQMYQMMRTRNFRVQNEVVGRRSVTKSQKGKEANVEGKVGECFQWKAHGQCSEGDSCSFSHDTIASGNSGKGARREGRSSSPAPNSKAKTDGKEGNKDESSDKRSQILCRHKTCKNPSCKFWHLPVCQNYRSQKGCTYGGQCHFRHVEAEEKHNKRSNGGGANRSVAILKESTQLGCVQSATQNFHYKILFLAI